MGKTVLLACKLCFHRSRRNGAAGEKQNIMLAQFTWQQFLVAAMILSLVWYLGVARVYYRSDISRILFQGNKQQPPERLQRDWEEELEDGPEEENLMGSVREPEGVSSVPMEALHFVEKPVGKQEHRLGEKLGLIPDVLEELKGIFAVLEKEGGNKKDFFSLIGLVKEKYPKISSSDSLEEINRFIRDHITFSLSNEEMENLWI